VNKKKIIAKVILKLGSWKPVMTEKEAKAWSSGSKIKGIRYHGSPNADKIRKEGFINMRTPAAHLGFMFTNHYSYALKWARGNPENVLTCMFNVSNPLPQKEHSKRYKELEKEGKFKKPDIGVEGTAFLRELRGRYEWEGYDSIDQEGGEIVVFHTRKIVILEDDKITKNKK